MTDAHRRRARAIVITPLAAFGLLAASCSVERPFDDTAHVTGIGRAATPAEIHAWDIDVNPTGSNLPPGSGSYASGATVFAQKCAACHGAHGEGIGPYPRLIGRDPRTGFPFGQDPSYVKTVGNYWPYATTLFDYVRRAMPLTQPGSLHDDEVYGVVDYLLAENQVVGRDAVMNAQTLPRVTMPARGHFVPDDRTGGRTFR